jgi:hypothetical protein
MPRSVDSFVAWRLLWYVYQRLQLIQRANGYNTDAAVFLSLEEYRQSSDKWALLVYSDADTPEDQMMGGGNGSPRVHNRTSFTIMGSIQYEGDFPSKAAMALEQDVRTALQTGVDGVRALAGANVSFRWEPAQRFITALSGEREAGFSVSCSYLYPQGSTW